MREITMQSFATTGPVVNWFKLPESGERLLTLVSAINTPAVAAAFCTQSYTAKANDEISLQIGDLISVIDMSDKSMWWRGKRSLEVGFFPAKCVEVISEQAPLLNLENLKNTLLRRKSLQRQHRSRNENENPFIAALKSTDTLSATSVLATPNALQASNTTDRLFKPMFDNQRPQISSPIAVHSLPESACSARPASDMPDSAPPQSTSSSSSSPSAAAHASHKKGKLSTFFRSFIGRPNTELDILEINNKRKMKTKSSNTSKKNSKSNDRFAFGNDLAAHLSTTARSLPLVLSTCCEFLEQNGVVHGIYRLSGLNSNIQKLIKCYNADQTPDFTDDIFLQDVHCVASLLKLYFRELPNPLLTYELYENFVKAIHPSYPNESLSSANTIPETTKLDNLVQVLQLLPLPNYETLEYLIRHLSRIASHADQTGMTVKNLAIVWAPNLLRSRELETQGGIGALQCIAIQAVLTEYLIRFVDRLFTPHSRPSRGLSKVAPSLCPNISPNRIELIHERVEITTTKTLRMRHEPSDDEQQRPLADTESGESQDEDVDESKKKATPIVGRKNGNDSNTYLRLITLKEARTRWERRRMIESQPNSTSDGRSNVDREVQIERIESIDRLCVQSESNEQPYESPLQMDESKIVLRHPNRCRKMNVIETPDSKPSSPIDRSFGVIGQFSSFRSKRNFGNLDLITNDCDDANEDEKVLKSIDSHVASSQLSSKSKFDFKDGSSNELRKCATFQPTINRYHTILNPKHFRKNKVNPNRFGQIQSQLNHYRSSED